MPDTLQTREHLRRVPFLSSLSDQHADALAKSVRSRELAPGTQLFKKGQQGDSMVIVAKGRLSVRVEDGPGATEVAAIYPGEVVGEMSCVDPAARSANVVASKASLVLEVERRMLLAIEKHAPKVSVAIVGGVISHLTRRIRDTNERLEREMDSRGLSSPSKGNEPTRLPGDSGNAAMYKDADAGRIDLRALKCFEGFSNKELKAFLTAAPARKYADGAVLCREGDPGTSCYIIARGAVHVVRHMSGSDRILATLDKGTLVGQMALVDRSPRSATIKAAGETVVLELKREAFQLLLEAASMIAVRFQHQIAVAGIRQLRSANDRLASVLSGPSGSSAGPAKGPAPPHARAAQAAAVSPQGWSQGRWRLLQRPSWHADQPGRQAGATEAADERQRVRRDGARLHADRAGRVGHGYGRSGLGQERSPGRAHVGGGEEEPRRLTAARMSSRHMARRSPWVRKHSTQIRNVKSPFSQVPVR